MSRPRFDQKFLRGLTAPEVEDVLAQFKTKSILDINLKRAEAVINSEETETEFRARCGVLQFPAAMAYDFNDVFPCGWHLPGPQYQGRRFREVLHHNILQPFLIVIHLGRFVWVQIEIGQ
jgi:hypothetical protein